MIINLLGYYASRGKMKVDYFLKQAKLSVKQQVRIVIGNMSADLDSIASAISLAFYLHHKTGLDYVPVVNSTKSVIVTKKACTFMFEQLSVDLDDLVFIGDLDRDRIIEAYLVDHNELDMREKQDLGMSELVTGVIDHHLDKGEFKNANPRTIDFEVGSNASLIVDMFRQAQIELDPSFATMLLFPIVNDTCNLTRIAHQIDVEAVAYLTRFTCVDRKELNAQLDQFKFGKTDYNNVSLLLAQDCKVYSGDGGVFGMSALTFDLVEWIRCVKNFKNVLKFMDNIRVDFFGLLSFHRDEKEEYKRDLVLVGDEATINGFVDLNMSSLALIETVYSHPMSCAIFKVNDPTLSRKYWHPMLEHYLKTLRRP